MAGWVETNTGRLACCPVAGEIHADKPTSLDMNPTINKPFPRDRVKRILVELVDMIADQLDARPQTIEKPAPASPPAVPAAQPKVEEGSSYPKMLHLVEVGERTGLSRTSIYKYMQLDAFPRPRKLGPRISRWLSTDIDDWMQGSYNQQSEPKGRTKS